MNGVALRAPPWGAPSKSERSVAESARCPLNNLRSRPEQEVSAAVTNTVPPTATVDRAHLIDALDTLADAAHAIETSDDEGRPPDDATQLVMRLREIITTMSFEVEASDFLAGIPGEGGSRPKRDAAWQRGVEGYQRLRQADVRHADEREAILSELAAHGEAAPATCGDCGAVISLGSEREWVHATDAPDCPMGPWPADRRADVSLTLRVDADGYPLVWADKDDDVVLVLLGEKGASAAGISATIAFPATTVRRWFRDVLVGLRRVLAERDESAEPT